MFETLVMADSVRNYVTAAGVMVPLGVLLFVVRVRKSKGEKKLNTVLAASPFHNFVDRYPSKTVALEYPNDLRSLPTELISVYTF
jgi:hypothetical protein